MAALRVAALRHVRRLMVVLACVAVGVAVGPAVPAMAVNPGCTLKVYSNLDGHVFWPSTAVSAGMMCGTAPAMVRSASGTYIAVTADDGSVWVFSNADGTPTWTGSQATGPDTTTGNPAIA